jgi:hypothetical protein
VQVTSRIVLPERQLADIIDVRHINLTVRNVPAGTVLLALTRTNVSVTLANFVNTGQKTQTDIGVDAPENVPAAMIGGRVHRCGVGS